MSYFGTKQTLAHKLQQKLSPQQIQLMKLLQIPTATLEQRIKEELEANPALDEGDESTELLEGLSELDISERDTTLKDKEKEADSDQDEGGDDDYELSDNTSEDQENSSNDDDYEEKTAMDDGYELEDYLVDYIEDDPSSYKTQGEKYSS